MKKRWIKFMFMSMMLGACAPSPGPDSPEATLEISTEVSGKKPLPFKNPGKEIITNNQRNASVSATSTHIDRVIDTLKYSDLAHERAADIGAFADAMRIRYDWKEDPSKYPHLRGGKEDPIGKFIHVMANRYYDYEATSGLIEIFKNKNLLLELIDYFTSEPILSQEEYEVLKTAIKEKDIEKIEQMIDAIYIHFYSHFDLYYHTDSQWEPSQDPKDKDLLKPKRGGFQEQQNAYFNIKGIYKIDLRSTMPVLIGTKKGQGRIRIVKLITYLVLKYYDIQPEKK